MSLEQEMRADAIRPTKDKLDLVRAAVRTFRDLDMEIKGLEERIKGLNGQKMIMMHQTLPDVFMANGIDSLTLQKEGNFPSYEATLSDFYHASVSVDWSPEEQDQAFALLTKRKAADLIKHTVEIRFGLREASLFKRFMEMLKKFDKALYTRTSDKKSVPWNTLKSYVREIYEKGGALTDEELRILGATVGKIVKLKEIHDE
jgi:hypothetical protein